MTRHDPQHNDPLAQRLESLGRALPPRSPEFTDAVLHKLAGEPAGHIARHSRALQLKRWIMRGTLGLAASALIGTFAWTLLVSEPEPAYGIQDVRQQLAAVRSIRVAGTGQGGAKFEVYAQRPDRSYRVQGPYRTVMTGHQYMIIDDASKTATLSPSSPFDARFITEMVLQNVLIDQLLGPAKDRLKKVRTQQVGDVTADVYESIVEAAPRSLRSEIFFNPRTGLPIKSTLHLRSGDGREMPVVTIDHIEPDAPAPAGLFDFKAPDGYALRHADAKPHNLQTIGSGVAGDTHFGIRYAFELPGGRAMLVCWSLYDQTKPADDLQLPAEGTLSILGPKSPYTERTLRTDPADAGHHWRWSLVTCTDPAVRVADNPPTFQLKPKGGATLSFTSQAVRFDPAELPQLLLDAQRPTLPEDQQPLTLESLERELSK